ncbi:MAG TPA: long-chain-fatty-acid--CoA ligase [Steroidobacteraceae bacterium]|jgi:fatty-acyl-CoA synthase
MADAFGTLADLVRLNARERGNSAAFFCEGRRSTFAEFHATTSRVANGLIAAGITDQARFAYLCRNSERVYEMFYGGVKARAVAVGVNWRLSCDEVAYILTDSEARLMFTDAATLALARAAAAKCPLISQILVLDAPSGEPACDYLTWRGAQCDTDPAGEVGLDDVACQLYTSGTTGRPKGVLLTHRNFMEQRRAAADSGRWMNAEEGSVALVVMPTYHVGGLTMGTIAFHQGATTVVSKDPDPDCLIATIEQHRVTQLFLVPTVIQSLLDRCESKPQPLRSLRLLRYGAAPISAALLRQARATLSCELLQVYGMTEATGTVTCLPPADHDDSEAGGRMRSCGIPLAHVDVRIMDGQGRTVPAGVVGEICIRAGSVMAGYWKQPRATAEAFYGDWYRSGDAGYLDEAGYLYLRDRIKDMIISGGENIYPAEVENAICDHEAVLEAAVIGVPDPRWGEAMKAIVVLRSGSTVSQADLIQFIRERLAGFKVPKSIDFVARLPRNPSGKILRRELRLPFWSDRESQIA